MKDSKFQWNQLSKDFPVVRLTMAIVNAVIKEGVPYLLKKMDPELKKEIEKFQLNREQTEKQEKIRNKLFPGAIVVTDYKVIENDNRPED